MKQYKLFPAQLRYAPTAYGQPKRTTVMEVVLSLSTLPSSTHESPDKKVLYLLIRRAVAPAASLPEKNPEK